MRDKSGKLREQLSETDTGEAIDFEITLAALLATASITYPIPQLALASQATAFAVLILTLTRRMAILSAFIEGEDDDSRREWFMRWTIPFLEFASVTTVLLLIYVLFAEVASKYISSLSYWIGVSIAIILLVIIQEVVFRDELIWWYHKFAERVDPDAHKGSIWAFVSWKTWNWSHAPIADHGRGRFQYGPSSNQEYSLTENLRFLAKGIGLYVLVNAIILYFSFEFFGLAGLALVFAIGAIRDQIRFWLSVYGNSSFDQISGHWYRTYLMIFVYLLTFRFLL